MDITLILIATAIVLLISGICALVSENDIKQLICLLLMVGIAAFAFFYRAQRTIKKEVTIDGHKHEWIYHGWNDPVHIENECIYCINKKDSINNF